MKATTFITIVDEQPISVTVIQFEIEGAKKANVIYGNVYRPTEEVTPRDAAWAFDKLEEDIMSWIRSVGATLNAY